MSYQTIRLASLSFATFIAVLWSACPALAGTEGDSTLVNCALQSANLNFGRIYLKRSPIVAGEGEAVVICQNIATEMRHIELSFTFPTLGRKNVALQSGRGSLAATFYRDAQFAVRWGDDHSGSASRNIPLDLAPGERRKLRVPVYALLQIPHDAASGSYLTQVPITLTMLPK